MTNPRWQAVFFDFDGVIADSVQVKTNAFTKMFRAYGQKVVDQVIAYHLANGGMPRYLKFEYYYKELLGKELNRAELERLGADFSALVVDGVIAAALIPGAEQSLQQLQQEKIPAFIVSGTPHDEMLTIAKQKRLDQYFLEIHGSPRNKTEILLDIIERRNYQPEKCLFIGDAVADYRAANAAGMHFLGITGAVSAVTFPKGTLLSPVVTTSLPRGR